MGARPSSPLGSFCAFDRPGGRPEDSWSRTRYDAASRTLHVGRCGVTRRVVCASAAPANAFAPGSGGTSETLTDTLSKTIASEDPLASWLPGTIRVAGLRPRGFDVWWHARAADEAVLLARPVRPVHDGAFERLFGFGAQCEGFDVGRTIEISVR